MPRRRQWGGWAWDIDGIALVVACVLLTLRFFRLGQVLAPAGFLVFALGESLLESSSSLAGEPMRRRDANGHPVASRS